MIKWILKRFNELSGVEVYQILQLRSEVFVVEQNCVYQDIDDKDSRALHLLGYERDQLIAYARLFKRGDYFEEMSIGRVVVRADRRRFGFGHELMKQAIKDIQQFDVGEIVISAQLYLQKFYEQHGFIAEGESYPEDDIPHIRMRRF